MEITKPSINDFNEINLIFKEVHNLHQQNRPDIFKMNNHFTKEEFQNILNDSKEIFLIIKDKHIIGFIHATINNKESNNLISNKNLFISSFGIKKEYQNKGLGTKLFKELKKIAINQKCDNIILNVWSFNNNAITFYLKQGFKKQRKIMEIKL